jgi:hypothetical protein
LTFDCWVEREREGGGVEGEGSEGERGTTRRNRRKKRRTGSEMRWNEYLPKWVSMYRIFDSTLIVQ